MSGSYWVEVDPVLVGPLAAGNQALGCEVAGIHQLDTPPLDARARTTNRPGEVVAADLEESPIPNQVTDSEQQQARTGAELTIGCDDRLCGLSVDPTHVVPCAYNLGSVSSKKPVTMAR
jgi:hypothetical protein